MQHDYTIANQGFPATRADINNALSAIATNNSGTSAPSTQYAGQFWIDTTSSTWTLYIHDGADDIQFATIDTSANTVNFIDSELGDNSVTTAKIADGNVTSAKLSYPLTTFSSTGIDDNATSTAITINSSEQVEFTAGTAFLPSITTTGDTNTGIFFPAENTIAFTQGENESMRITNSGNVGIGTSSPAHNVEIVATASGSINDSLQIRNNSSATGTGSRIRFINSPTATSDVNGASIASVRNGEDNDLIFETENTERMRIDSSGNVGIGTTTPDKNLEVSATTDPTIRIRNTTTSISNAVYGTLDWVSLDTSLPGGAGAIVAKIDAFDELTYGDRGALRFFTHNASSLVEGMRIDSSGNLKFNSGFGSVGTAYGCRAWVNFNGTGTVAIREDGNVTSITDIGTGSYLINFTNALTDTNFCVVATKQNTVTNVSAGIVDIFASRTTSVARVSTLEDAISTDSDNVNVAIFR